MKTRVSDLTPEEFQRTFPIELRAYNPAYPQWYAEERERVLNAVERRCVVRFSHIGSTAVPGLIAKPVIDMLLEMDGCCNVTKLLEDLKTIGFGEEILTRREDPLRLLLAKGMTVHGFADKVFLLHVRYAGDWNELYFRDYLLAHPDAAAVYGMLKQKILDDIQRGAIQRMPDGKPNGYSQAKLAWVEQISSRAKAEFGEKYSLGKMEQNGKEESL